MGRRSIELDQADCDYVRKTYKYDPETGKIFFAVSEGRKAGKETATSVEKGGYRVMFVNLPSRKRGLKAHLVAWLLYYGVWPDHEVDHWDNDKTNNAVRNLRRATGNQNRGNIRKYKTYGGKPTSSQYKGVSWVEREKKWRSYIRVKSKLVDLGAFDSEREAALAYNVAATKHFGDFAILNEVKEEEQKQVS